MINQPIILSQTLRNPSDLHWYIVPLFVVVIYIYFVEIERKNWGSVFLGIAFWSWAMTWEIGNSLLYRFSGFAPLWTAEKGIGSYLIYIGMNLEICFFVAITGLMLIKILPADRHKKILKVPSRIFIPLTMGFAAVTVELFLNRGGLISWSWYFWGNPHIWPIWIGYSFTWFLLTAAHDYLTLKQKKYLMFLMFGTLIILHFVFAIWLNWV
jgi:hypothetical protein